MFPFAKSLVRDLVSLFMLIALILLVLGTIYYLRCKLRALLIPSRTVPDLSSEQRIQDLQNIHEAIQMENHRRIQIALNNPHLITAQRVTQQTVGWNESLQSADYYRPDLPPPYESIIFPKEEEPTLTRQSRPPSYTSIFTVKSSSF